MSVRVTRVADVPAVHAPAANGLGFVFPADATAVDAELVRLLPTGSLAGTRRATASAAGGRWPSPYVIFGAPDDRPWPAGLYRMDIRWTDADGPHSAAAHLDLQPGPLQPTPPA